MRKAIIIQCEECKQKGPEEWCGSCRYGFADSIPAGGIIEAQYELLEQRIRDDRTIRDLRMQVIGLKAQLRYDWRPLLTIILGNSVGKAWDAANALAFQLYRPQTLVDQQEQNAAPKPLADLYKRVTTTTHQWHQVTLTSEQFKQLWEEAYGGL